MNGPIAQAVALTCHANAAPRGISRSKFLLENSTCQFCDRVTFVRVQKTLFGKAKEVPVAATPNDWFAKLIRERTRGLRLIHESGSGPLSDRTSAGFVGGGGSWFLEAVGTDGGSRFWIARWDVWDQNAPERRIWRVTYGLVAERRTQIGETSTLEVSCSALLDALRDIEKFAREHDLGHFADSFTKAIESLTMNGDPEARLPPRPRAQRAPVGKGDPNARRLPVGLGIRRHGFLE